jgi:hypothetical protein
VLLPLVLTLLGGCAALLPAVLGFPDPPDFVPLAVLGLGAAWGIFQWRRRPGRGRAVVASIQVLAAGGMAYWMLFFSSYGAPAGAPRVGDRAPDISAVRVRDGARFDLAAERGHPVLLVFFRGHW